MKYDNFKIFKFSTILKSINRAKDSFLRSYKKIKRIPSDIVNILAIFTKYIFSVIYKSIKFVINDFSKISKKIINYIYSFLNFFRYLNFKRYNILKIFDLLSNNFSKIYRNLDIKKYANIPIYIFASLIFSFFIYLSIPLFYDYDKSKFESTLCKSLNATCSIEGKIGYSFFPSPRIKIQNLIVQDFVNKKKVLGKIKNVAIKISFKNLLNKSKLNFTKIDLKNADLSFDLGKLEEYKNFSKKKFSSKPINLKGGKIEFFNGDQSITVIRDITFKYKTKKDIDDLILKGIFLNDDIFINLKSKKNKSNLSRILTLKFLDIKSEIDLLFPDSDKEIASGTVSFKKNKNKITSIVNYKDNEIIVKQANLRNAFLDGKFYGSVKLLPFFNFNLNFDLNGINFNTLHSSLVALDDKSKQNLFKFNKKINGQINLSSNKVFSKRTLVDSFESRIKFINGNILIEQMILNLGKIGAADITGSIHNNEKFSNFKFEANIFFDNLKRFYNKFGIFNKTNKPSNLFMSGIFDLVKLEMRLDEISNEKEFEEEDVVYFEKEFNNVLLQDGYLSLFDFTKLKEFMKLIFAETN